MTILWLGDFRIKQFQQAETAYDISEHGYLVDDFAEYSWFVNNAVTQLPLFALDNTNIVFMLGFNDCVYSCVWKAFDTDDIADKYADTLSMLAKQYPNSNFYICSVNPVDADYPFAESPNGVIEASILNKKIESFNSKLKALCKVNYIDSYTYLSTTSFDTIDGVRFTPTASNDLQNYIINHLNLSSSWGLSSTVAKPERSKAPVPDDDSFVFWRSTSKGGYNTYGERNVLEGYKNVGSTLPNCTAWAWGRFYEILGEKPKLLSLNNAEEWFLADGKHNFGNDGYRRGDIPMPGAVMCWSKGNPDGTTGGAEDGAGHVAIVEQVNTDGSVLTSESGYSASSAWWLATRSKGDDGNWGQSSAYKFQGFIYCPTVVATPASVNVAKGQVIAKKGYLTRTEMETNAKYIWKYLGTRGWTLNAVAGILGNMQHESTINPGLHESAGSGFGLVQWTPKSKFTNWATPLGYDELDIDGQLERIIEEKNKGIQYSKKHYKYTFKEFSESLDDPYTLACAFAWEYEKSGVTQWGFHTNKCGAYCGRAAFNIACRRCYANKYGEAATEVQAEKNRQALRDKRGGAALEWYKLLLPNASGNTFETSFRVNNLKLNQITPTSISASFIINRGISGYYRIISQSGEELTHQQLNVKVSDSDANTVTFSYDSLKPNTSYKLIVAVTDEVSHEERELTKDFDTPEDYPYPIKSVILATYKEAFKDGSIPFNLTIKQPEYLGYWGKTGKYDILLIVNNKCVKTLSINSITDISWGNFTIKDKFGYDCKVGDTVQIGVQVCVTDDNNIPICTSVKTSEPICLLNKSIVAYLNTN